MLSRVHLAFHARIQDFSSGGSGSVCQKKSPDNVFLVLSLFYCSQMVDFEENYHFSRFLRGSNISRGASNFFQGGPIAYTLITCHITCDFPGGSRPPDPLLDPHLLSRPAGDSFFPFSRCWVVFFRFIQILIDHDSVSKQWRQATPRADSEGG